MSLLSAKGHEIASSHLNATLYDMHCLSPDLTDDCLDLYCVLPMLMHYYQLQLQVYHSLEEDYLCLTPCRPDLWLPCDR